MFKVGDAVKIVAEMGWSYSFLSGRKCRIKSQEGFGYRVDIPHVLYFWWIAKQHLKAVNQQLTFIFKE